MSFLKYILSLPMTDTAEGDFIGDVRRDENFRHIRSLQGLKNYLLNMNASDGCIDAAEKLWKDYQKKIQKEKTMTITARMICQNVDENFQYPSDATNKQKFGEIIRLTAVYSTDIRSPNYSFSKATPYAEIHMSITNPAAFDFFRAGETYDLTFEKHDAPTPDAA